MGEARRKRLLAQQQQPDTFDRDTFAKVLREVIRNVYGNGHCLVTALTAEKALQALGQPAVWQAGYAWWRVGSDAGAVLAHHPRALGGGAGGFWFHAWCLVGDAIADFTTWSWHEAFAELDAHDGRHTVVEWCPGYLWVSRHHTRTLAEVTQGHRHGGFGYQREPEVERRLRSKDSGAFQVAEQLAALVVKTYRAVVGKPFDIEVNVTRSAGVEAIETSELTLIRPAPRPLAIPMPTDDADIRRFLAEAEALGVEEITIVAPDDKTGELVPCATIRRPPRPAPCRASGAATTRGE